MRREEKDVTKYNRGRFKKSESNREGYSNEDVSSNKFKGLEIKIKKFEKAVLLHLEVSIQNNTSCKLKAQTRDINLYTPSISLKKNPFRNKEQHQFIDLLVEIFLKYLNNNVMFISDSKIRELIKHGKRDSPLIIACCSLSFPFSTNLTFGKCLLFKDNYFYFKLKRIAEDLSGKDYLHNSFLLQVCYLIEFNQGYNDIAFKSCIKGIKLMHASGLVNEIMGKALLKNRDDFSLDRSILWNYWINCELLGVRNNNNYILYKPKPLNLCSILGNLTFTIVANE
ncbi:hypothetical protein K502DRAFT_367517, partial [Neoconidiobolus thromboides FSU 785]